MVNKFNIHWQIVRVKARAIKDVDSKIIYVLGFLTHNKNKHNYERVSNWLKMTGVAYTGGNRDKFEYALSEIKKVSQEYQSDVDNDNILSSVSEADLRMVYKDLSTRKYNFQFKSVPKAHTEFMEKLEKELKIG